MNTLTVHYKTRPIKTAFLINCDSGLEPILSTIQFCQKEWGGRYNVIIPTDGNNISEAWMSLLRLHDPDNVIAIPDISDVLKEKLERSLTFTKYESIDDIKHGRPREIYFDVKKAIPIYESRHIVVFRESPDKILRLTTANNAMANSFYIVNFGIFDNFAGNIELFNKVPDHVNINIDEEPLENIFIRLNCKDYNPITLNDLCAYKAEADLFESDCYNDDESFQVVMGDHPSNLIYTWNRIFLRNRYKHRRHLSRYQMWLSNEIVDKFITDNVFLEGFIEWLKKHSRVNEQFSSVVFISYDEKNNKYDALKTKVYEGLRKKTGMHVNNFEIKYFSKDDFPKVKKEYEQCGEYIPDTCILIENKNDIPIYSLQMPKPDIMKNIEIKDKIFDKASWVVEYQMERYTPHIINMNERLKFPYRRDLSNAFDPNRISTGGNVVSYASSADNRLDIRVPTNHTLFAHMLRNIYHPVFYKSGENPIRQNKYIDNSTSDKGRYLRGFIDLFGSIDTAARHLESPFWREILEYMAGKKPSIGKAPPNNTNKIYNKLKNNINDEISSKSDEGRRKIIEDDLVAIAVILAEKSSEEKGQPKEITIKEIQSYRSSFANEKIYDHIFEDDFEYLIERGIFLQGFRPLCPRCGSRFWYSLEEIRAEITCTGCSHQYHLHSEEEWSYRFNSLCANAIRDQGVIPVILALKYLENCCRNAFSYISQQDLFCLDPETQKPKHKTDVDIVCTLNGKLVIGEAKSSLQRALKKEVLESCRTLVEEIKPDVFVMYIMEPFISVSKNKKDIMIRFKKK